MTVSATLQSTPALAEILVQASSLLGTGRAQPAYEQLTAAIAAADAGDADYEAALRQALVAADAARNPKWVIAAGTALRAHLVAQHGPGHADIAKLLLQQAEMVMMERDPAGAELLAAEALDLRQATRAAAPGQAADTDVLEAMLAVARYKMAAGQHDELPARLAEVRALLKSSGLAGEDHDVPLIGVLRIEMTVAEKAGRRDDAMAAIEEILRLTPDTVQHGQIDLDANKVQMLVKLARLKLAQGQAAAAAADVIKAEALLAGLKGKIPDRPADMVRATLLGLGSDAAARQGHFGEAGEKYEVAMAMLDRQSGPEIDDLRKRTQGNWAAALRSVGREAEAIAVLARPRAMVAPLAGLGGHSHGHGGHGH